MEEFIYTEFADRNFRIIKEWEKIKEDNPAFGEVFKGMEIEAVKEIYEAKEIVNVHDRKVSEFLEPGLDFSSEIIRYLIEKIGYMSIYNRKVVNCEDGSIIKSMNVDNVTCFRAVIIINLLAIVGYALNDSIKFELNIIFENEDYEVMLGEMIKRLFPQVIKQITNIIFEIKPEEEINQIEISEMEDVQNDIEKTIPEESDEKEETVETIKKEKNEESVVLEKEIVEDKKDLTSYLKSSKELEENNIDEDDDIDDNKKNDNNE